MKIKKKIIEQINNVPSRKRISDKLNIGDQMLYLHLRRNSYNGRLTKMDALKAISEETGMAVDEILEEAKVSKVGAAK